MDACWGGAFMENVVNATQPHHASTTSGGHAGHAAAGGHDPHEPAFLALDPDEPLYPCTVVAARHRASCYLMQTSAILFRNGGDFHAAGAQCERIEGRLANACFVSLGRDAAAYAGSDDVAAVRLCMAAGPRALPWCVVGTVKNRVDVAAAPAPGLAYCTAVPEGPVRTGCYRAIGEQLTLLRGSPAERASECAAVAEAYRSACRLGAFLPENES